MKTNRVRGCLAICLSAGLLLAGQEDFCTIEDYRPVKMESKGLQPFDGQFELRIIPGNFGDSYGRDFIAEGIPGLFGSMKVLHRFLRLENGVPVYAPGEPMPDGPSPWKDPCPALADVDGDGVEDLLTGDWSYQGHVKGFRGRGLIRGTTRNRRIPASVVALTSSGAGLDSRPLPKSFGRKAPAVLTGR